MTDFFLERKPEKFPGIGNILDNSNGYRNILKGSGEVLEGSRPIQEVPWVVH